MSKQGSPEWLADRLDKVTASNVGAILGLSPYADRDSVMRSMVREHFGAKSEFDGNIATQWGNDHEGEALAALESDQGVFVQACGSIQHPKNEWLAASPDGLVDSNTVVEVKCPFKKEIFNLSTRPDYMAQVQIQMYCTERTKGLFGVWVPGYIEVTPVEIDTLWLCEVLPMLMAFHDEYMEIIGDKDLSAPYLEDLVQDMSLNVEWEEQAAIYLEHKEAIDRHKKSMDESKALLIELAGGKKSQGSSLMAYPVAGKSTTDYKTLLADNPGIDVSEYNNTGKGSWMIKKAKG